MPVTYLDLVVIGVTLVSALLAMLRGFTREVLAIASWAVAAAAAYALYPLALPHAQQYISNATAAKAAAGGAIFLVTLIIAYFVTAKISDLVLDSKVGALDRTLGFLFGAMRGLLITVILFIFFQWLIGNKEQPSWVKDAKTRNILETASIWVRGLLPDDPEALIQQYKPQKGPGNAPPAESEPQPEKKTEATPQRSQNAQANPTYPSKDRQGIQSLIETTGSTPRPKPLSQ